MLPILLVPQSSNAEQRECLVPLSLLTVKTCDPGFAALQFRPALTVSSKDRVNPVDLGSPEFTLRQPNEVIMIQISKPDFPIGKLLATPAAIEALQKTDVEIIELVERHIAKDCGDLSDEGKKLNDEALHDGSRILSAYNLDKTRVNIWSSPKPPITLETAECVAEEVRRSQTLPRRCQYQLHRTLEGFPGSWSP